MMAEMLKVSVRAVRLWQRSGLLHCQQVVMGVPLFDFHALLQARTFSHWLKAGLTASSIVHQLSDLSRLSGLSHGEVVKLPIQLEGKRLVISRGDLQIEASGQLQLSFQEVAGEDPEPVTLRFISPVAQCPTDSARPTLMQLMERALSAENDDQLDLAAQIYRTALANFGPNAEINFQLAEVLYRAADLGGARERYFAAIELDPNLVEALANLGCVLSECGQMELAIDCFLQALKLFPDYADVHFHLARALDDMNRESAARDHWRRFIQLAPASPWADEAAQRLGESEELDF
jgi:tetratricopeptide (TPR) repeat protein